MKKYRKFILVTLLILACILPYLLPDKGCYRSPYKSEAQKIMYLWADAHGAARGVTDRPDFLMWHVAELGRVRQQALKLRPSGCAQEAHELMLDYMDAMLQAYEAYMQGNRGQGDRFYERADKMGDRWIGALRALNPSPGKFHRP